MKLLNDSFMRITWREVEQGLTSKIYICSFQTVAYQRLNITQEIEKYFQSKNSGVYSLYCPYSVGFVEGNVLFPGFKCLILKIPKRFPAVETLLKLDPTKL